jgi:hypothetical protein
MTKPFKNRLWCYSKVSLIRCALATHAIGGSFCVFCDERRPDLIEQWYTVMSAIRGCDLRIRLKIVTRQARTNRRAPHALQKILLVKYGITPAKT